MIDAIIIICSREKSSRLPRKAFRKISGIRAIDHILLRASHAYYPMVLAVPKGEAELYKQESEYELVGRILHEGNPESPLHRTADVLKSFNPIPKWTIRITHDDILIDVKTMQALLERCEIEDADYGISPGIVEGAGVEVIRSQNIIKAAESRQEPTEYISYCVKGDKTVRLDPRPEIRRPYRLTMDYPEDAKVLEIVLRELGPLAELDLVCAYLDQNQHILEINRLPEFTFYTCVHNGDRFITECVDSVLSYSYLPMEYIIVDDYSSDSTLKHLSKYESSKSVEIITNEKNLGLASSSNVAITQARGKYIMRVDADDMFFANRANVLLKMRDMIEKDGYSLVYPSYLEITDNDVIVRTNCDPKESKHAGCALMDKKALNEIRFKEDLRHWDGLDLYNRFTKNGLKAGFTNDLFWIYRIRHDSMSRTNNKERQDCLRKLI